MTMEMGSPRGQNGVGVGSVWGECGVSVGSVWERHGVSVSSGVSFPWELNVTYQKDQDEDPAAHDVLAVVHRRTPAVQRAVGESRSLMRPSLIRHLPTDSPYSEQGDERLHKVVKIRKAQGLVHVLAARRVDETLTAVRHEDRPDSVAKAFFNRRTRLWVGEWRSVVCHPFAPLLPTHKLLRVVVHSRAIGRVGSGRTPAELAPIIEFSDEELEHQTSCECQEAEVSRTGGGRG